MNNVFINKEAKRSTTILILILTTFMMLQLWMYNNNLQKQKEDYIDIIGTIIYKSVSLNPEIEKDIIPLVTKSINDADKKYARDLLKQYGITYKLNDNLFPSINNNFDMVILCFILCCILITLNYIQYDYFFKKIRNLTLAASKILDDDYTYLINEDKEGDLSKLSVEFSNIRRVIKNNISNTQNEKQYLVELLQNVSHQLKTKLATMILYNDILLNRKITEKQRVKFLEDNSNQLDNMNIMIHSILKLAKLDAKTIDFSKQNCSLNQTVKEVVADFEDFSKDRSVSLEFDDNQEIVLNQDKFWIKEALNNIIKNSIEHTKEGGSVRVCLSSTTSFDRLVIEDTGEGIKQCEIPKIFNRFYKSPTSNKRDSVGIGLAISKSIIKNHNGYIDVKSEVGMGTSFIITFMR